MLVVGARRIPRGHRRSDPACVHYRRPRFLEKRTRGRVCVPCTARRYAAMRAGRPVPTVPPSDLLIPCPCDVCRSRPLAAHARLNLNPGRTTP